MLHFVQKKLRFLVLHTYVIIKLIRFTVHYTFTLLAASRPHPHHPIPHPALKNPIVKQTSFMLYYPWVSVNVFSDRGMAHD